MDKFAAGGNVKTSRTQRTTCAKERASKASVDRATNDKLTSKPRNAVLVKHVENVKKKKEKKKNS